MAEPLVAFTGAVSCERAAGVAGFTLRGHTAERPGEPAALSFAAAAPADLPATLLAPRVECAAPGDYLIAAGERSWRIAARGVELHREVAPAFYRALPPRPVPLGKRLFWRVVLALAASRAGLALLRRLRR